jgi:hypothetical protein
MGFIDGPADGSKKVENGKLHEVRFLQGKYKRRMTRLLTLPRTVYKLHD